MSCTTADTLVQSLLEWGVQTVFSLPGDGIKGIIEALGKRKHEIQFIQVRHEEFAAFAQIVHADRQCVGFVGDSGFSMLMAEFVTAVKDKLPIKIIVIKNDTLGQIKWEQMIFLGDSEYECELASINFSAFARACGGEGYSIQNPDDCGRILREALAHPGPVLIEAEVDPFEPPIPAKMTLDEGPELAESLVNCLFDSVV
jgi:thiamine pyrophosphate-dependent acetolactate synthase large subunit-like protein